MRASLRLLAICLALAACSSREAAPAPQIPAAAPAPSPAATSPAPAHASSEPAQRDETTMLGALRVRLRGRGQRALLLLHGYGAPGYDLVPLGELLAREVPGLRVVLPEAPQVWEHGGEGRAWYERARPDVPAQIASARTQLAELLAALEAREGITADHVTFAGFSMGATMSIELTLHGSARPAGLVALSGNALPAFGTDWSAMRDLPVFVSHGHADPILPFRHGAAIRDHATEGGARVTFLEFEGGHAIPPEVIAGLITFLSAR